MQISAVVVFISLFGTLIRSADLHGDDEPKQSALDLDSKQASCDQQQNFDCQNTEAEEVKYLISLLGSVI